MLSINGSAYTTKLRNSFSSFISLCQLNAEKVGDVAEVRLKGLELEANMSPTDDCRFRFAWVSPTAKSRRSRIYGVEAGFKL